MVELGTRYLLNKCDGTDKFKRLHKSEIYGKQLTTSMLENFKDKDQMLNSGG